MMNNKLRFLKIPSAIYFTTMLLGIVIGSFFIHPQNGGEALNLLDVRDSNFQAIFINNGIIILFVYVSVLFSPYIAYVIYAANGLIHGVVFGWIIASNLKLLLLIIPHGIFEIPCILLTGFILSKNEEYIRENIMRFALLLLLHILFVGICAFIEAYISPCFQIYI